MDYYGYLELGYYVYFVERKPNSFVLLQLIYKLILMKIDLKLLMHKLIGHNQALKFAANIYD